MDIARSMGGPIPGQSLTKEPGASPWEKPPQFTDLDEAMEFLIPSITATKNAHRLVFMMERGVTITAILETILMTGFMEGKWTPDLMILLMKPLSALLMQIGNMYEVEYVTGAEDEDELEEEFVMLAEGAEPAPVSTDEPPAEEEAAPAPPQGGLMSPPQGV